MTSRLSALASSRRALAASPLALCLTLCGALAQQQPAAPQEIRRAEPPRAEAPAPAAPAPALPPEAAPAAAAPSSPAGQAATKSREAAPLVYARVSADPVPTLSPATFLDTLKMADRYQAFAEAGGWEALPANFAPKPGMRDPAIPSLRHHLTLTGDLPADAPASDRFDPPLVEALKSFQARHGLEETGTIGRRTLAALNVPAAVRQRQLSASAARLMGSNFPFGERYVVVNIPSAAVEAVERGSVARRYVAVVGSPDKMTPSVETRITDVNFNPTWTLPVSVVRNEIIPKMRKDAGWLARNHIRVLDGKGQEVEASSIDWKGEKAVNYTLRQDPGFDNSLGQVRIDMPNRHAVYMHDTPAKSYFTRDIRFHSHGCVRVGGVKELIGWLLQGVEGPNGPGSSWGPIEIETGIAGGERRDIKLGKPIPVTFVYLTGYATPDGRAQFRDDIYGLDTPATSAEKAAPRTKEGAPEVTTTGSIAPRKPVPSAGAGALPAKAKAEAPRPDARAQAPRPAPLPSPRATARSGEPALLPPGLVGPRG